MRRSPKAVGCVTVTFAETDRAVAGTPQAPAIGKDRVVPAARAGAAAPRVSKTRHGATVKKCEAGQSSTVRRVRKASEPPPKPASNAFSTGKSVEAVWPVKRRLPVPSRATSKPASSPDPPKCPEEVSEADPERDGSMRERYASYPPAVDARGGHPATGKSFDAVKPVSHTALPAWTSPKPSSSSEPPR